MSFYSIPIAPKSKPRAQVGQKRAYYGGKTGYKAWQASVMALLCERYGVPTPISGPFKVTIVFYLPSRGGCDLDNLAAGLMDALQPPGAKGHQGDPSLYPGVLWTDDRWLRGMRCEMRPAPESEQSWIEVTVTPVEEIAWPKKRRKKRSA